MVAAGLAGRCEVQLAYAIGVSQPVSVRVETFGTARRPEDRIAAAVRDVFDLSPRGMIEALDLRRPIYAGLARDGHFGLSGGGRTWEEPTRVEELRKAAGGKPAKKPAKKSARKPARKPARKAPKKARRGR